MTALEILILLWAFGFIAWLWTLGLHLIRWNHRRGGGDT